jgi:single-strand DNA-binding protein
MNNLNSILIEGNLLRDPQLRSTLKGTQVTQVVSFMLASNRYYKNEMTFEKEVSFFNVEAWSKLAEYAYRIGKKGRGVRVVGWLKQDRWQGVDGKPKARVTIVAEHIEFRPEFKKKGQPQEVPEEYPKAEEYQDETLPDNYEVPAEEEASLKKADED